MQWAKVVGGLATLAVVAGAGAALGVATRPSSAGTATAPLPPGTRVTAGVPSVTTSTSDRSTSSARPSSTARPSRTARPSSTAAPASTAPPASTTTVAAPLGGVELAPVQWTTANPADPAVAALSAALAPVVAAAPGCLVVTQGQKMLFQSNPTGLVAPGSTQKLLVAAAALDVLGPNYTFTTRVLAPAAPVGGTVTDLWLVGGGDPLLETPTFDAWWDGQARYAGDPFTDLTALAASVRTAGVTTVTGGVHGDDSRYDAVRLNPTWPSDSEADEDIAPMSALTLDMGFQSWTTYPAVVPPDPASFAAATFAQTLAAAGIAAPDNPPGADGVPPVGSVVVGSIQSAPLSEIIGAMLRPSDNQIAELLVKELGFHATGRGTTAAGLAVVQSVDTRLGIPWNSTVMVDGSGLSHTDRTTCATLLAALYLGDQPGYSAIPEGLAVGGQSGTLAKRFTTAPVEGHLHAKTGSIDDVAGMVGELDIGAPVRFAMVFNQVASDSQLLDDEDVAVAAMAPYP